MFFDFGGALGFLSTTFVSLYYPSLRAVYWDKTLTQLPPITSFATRQLLLSGALGIWSARLGSFLFARALRAGGDSRFDQIKKDPVHFSKMWFGQATWVFLVGLPVYMANITPANLHAPLGARDFASLSLVALSFGFEIIADAQKSAWRRAKKEKKHDEKFISSGLWALSRHPNYVGEIGIWTGMFGLASSSLWSGNFLPPKTAGVLSTLSPLLTYLLLRKVSGVPPLEKAGDKKFAGDAKWEEYKKTVPVFFPWGGYR
ncbi:DUF1295-domain-containing protein [Pterulicium gracile]|uniref:DUF1295-domain-containing protein n=1 Tax=Pterulicium gracile TaxID=1884261 RepID=A0A5C3QG40_9AGAR|nr:DUF1295-domain-containing protein [Pterula gracilis]